MIDTIFINYPISKTMLPTISGAILNHSITLPSTISVSGIHYKVHAVVPIRMKLFIHSGMLKIYSAERGFSSPKKIKEFYTSLGFPNLPAFIAAFFKDPKYSELAAECKWYYIQISTYSQLEPLFE